MKLVSFREHMKERLDPEKIKEIERRAEIEYESLKTLQQDVAAVLAQHMNESGDGFNDLIRKSGISPSQMSKITRGEANLTLASLAHIAGLLGKRAHLVFN